MRLPLTAFLTIALSAAAFAQNVHPDLTRTKSSDALRAVFRTVADQANHSTLSIRALSPDGRRRQVAFGTVVSPDGYLLTKASEVEGRKGLSVLLDGKDLDAKLVGVSEPVDLAMLKIENPTTKLTPIQWADLKKDLVQVGEWVASAGPTGLMGEEPVAVGVVSVGRRKIPGRNGFLGVSMGETGDRSGAKILQVLPGSAAEKAGLKVNDVVTAVDTKPVHSGMDLVLAVHQYRPGDVVTLTVIRATNGATEHLQATLGTNLVDQPSRFSMMNLLGGPVSKRASDFSAVFQHDTVLRPVDCGGPLVDLSGKAIGINIARAGRTETYALPADLILPLIPALESGRLAPVNANAPDANNGKPTTLPEQGE